MAVKARFYIQAINKQVAGSGQQTNVEVVLKPVTRNTDDNVEWSKYTPSGETKLWVTQDGARDWFEQRLGQDVMMTFEDPAES